MRIKLKQAFDLQMGKTPARNQTEYWGGSHRWVSIADIGNAGKYISKTKECITDAGIVGSGIKAVPQGTVIMSFKLSIGKTAITAQDMYTNEAIMAFIDKGVFAIDPNYLYHLCCGTDWTAGTNKAVMGLTLNKATLLEKEIPLPDISEQRKIAAKLDMIDAIIAERQQQLALIDQAVKSRFIELFGDPEQNPKGWPVVGITEIIGGKVSNGFFAKRDEYKDDGNVQVLGVANIVNRMYSNLENLPRTNATETDEEKYGVKYGDMLFCRSSLVAEGIGKASIVPQGAPANILFECHVIRLPLDLQKCVPEFVQVLSTTEFFRQQIIAQSKTATMTTIGQDGILKATIILPPIELQREFLRFVEQTDKSKLAIQQSLVQLETLKKALMQKYFG